MGNCVHIGQRAAKVVTAEGSVMEISGKVTVESIIMKFPEHCVYSSRNNHTRAMHPRDKIIPGRVYYVLPQVVSSAVGGGEGRPSDGDVSASSSLLAPYQRGSFDRRGKGVGQSGRSGVWKVKVAINSEQLTDILSEEGKVEELIDSVRTGAANKSKVEVEGGEKVGEDDESNLWCCHSFLGNTNSGGRRRSSESGMSR